MRARYTESIRITHPAWDEGKAVVARTIGLATQVRHPGGLLLLGSSGTGLTFFLEAVEADLALATPGHNSLLRADLRSFPRPDDFTTPLLTSLRFPARYLDRNIDSALAFADLASAAGIRGIAIDNIHLLLDAGTAACRSFANWLVKVHDSRGIGFFLAGYPVASRLRELFPEVASRVPTTVSLGPFRPNSLWQSITKTLSAQLPLAQDSGLGRSELALPLHSSTGGKMGNLKLLAHHGVPHATSNGTGLTLEILEKAHDEAFGSGSGFPNPFRKKI